MFFYYYYNNYNLAVLAANHSVFYLKFTQLQSIILHNNWFVFNSFVFFFFLPISRLLPQVHAAYSHESPCHVVHIKKLDSLFIYMCFQSRFVGYGWFFDDLTDRLHSEIPMEISVSNVPWCVNNAPQYLVLKSLYYVSVCLAGTPPQLDAICPHWFKDLFV